MSSAWSIWKDIGYPGTVHIPAADGRTHVYRFTRDDWRQIVATGKKKVRAGWHIPICWEHQNVAPDRVQLSNPDRDFALGVFASIEDFALTPDGRAKALLSGTDADDLRQLQKVKFVSPEITWNWRDTDGQLWRGPSVTHLAATPRPVQRHQNPIGSDPDRVPPGLRVPSLEKLVRMSFANSQNGGRVAARLRLSLDHYSGGARHMADDNDTPDTGTKKQTPYERIAAALQEHCGLDLGDISDVNNPDEFARLVEVAARNYKAGGEPDVPDEDNDEVPPEEGAPEGDMEQPPEGSQEVPQPPVQMSVTAANKPLVDRLIGEHRKGLVSRAEKIRRAGVLAPQDADELVEECRSCRLSLTANGDLIPNDTTKALTRFERVKPGAVVNLGGAKGKKARMSQGAPRNANRVEASPYQEQGEVDTQAVLDAWDRT